LRGTVCPTLGERAQRVSSGGDIGKTKNKGFPNQPAAKILSWEKVNGLGGQRVDIGGKEQLSEGGTREERGQKRTKFAQVNAAT